MRHKQADPAHRCRRAARDRVEREQRPVRLKFVILVQRAPAPGSAQSADAAACRPTSPPDIFGRGRAVRLFLIVHHCAPRAVTQRRPAPPAPARRYLPRFAMAAAPCRSPETRWRYHAAASASAYRQKSRGCRSADIVRLRAAASENAICDRFEQGNLTRWVAAAIVLTICSFWSADRRYRASSAGARRAWPGRRRYLAPIPAWRDHRAPRRISCRCRRTAS
jgi:hypothetical protein